MQKVLANLFFVTVTLGGVLVGSNQYSQELTTQFYTALSCQGYYKRNIPLCMSMFDDPAVVSKIDFSMMWIGHGDFKQWHFNALQLAVLNRDWDLVIKIFDLKKNDSDFAEILNQNNNGAGTVLHMLAWQDCPFSRNMVARILDRKDAQGNSIVNVDTVCRCGSTALMRARGEMVDILLKFKANVNVQNKYGYTALSKNADDSNYVEVKKLLISGADVTPEITGWFSIRKDFLDILRRSNSVSKNKKMILPIYDALKPDLIKEELSLHEQDVVQAYDEFLHGRHDELRNLLLVLPDIMRRKRINVEPFIEPIDRVFKRDSIKQLLLFLAEKKYQQNMAHYIIQSSSLKKDEER